MKLKTLKWLALGCLWMASSAHAAILWMGGEDVDFPNGAAMCASFSGSYIRSGYSRVGIHPCTANALSTSKPLPGGAVTSWWITARYACMGGGYYPGRVVGLVKSGTGNSLWVGSSATSGKVALWKYDGTSWTELATGGAGSLNITLLTKFDMQVINYGSSATVNIYLNGSGTAAITYSGDVTAGGATSLDSVGMYGDGAASTCWTSEVIVSDTDTRQMQLVTLVPNAAGDQNQWTGAYTNINPGVINDSSYITDNTSGDNFQCKMNALPSGNFAIQGVKVVARASQTGSGMASLSVGVKTNATVNVPTPVTQSGGWSTNETYYLTNPVTSTTWSTSELNALQINLQSGP